VLDYDCVEEIVFLFVQIIVYIYSCCRIYKKEYGTGGKGYRSRKGGGGPGKGADRGMKI
jgi:hypothetical protein